MQAGSTAVLGGPGTAGASPAEHINKHELILNNPAGEMLILSSLLTIIAFGFLETHNRRLDNEGNYSVNLGASEKKGLPIQLFSTEKAR